MVGAGAVAKASGWGFAKYLKVFGLSLAIAIFFIIFAHAIVESIQQRSFEPFLKEVGQRVVLASKALQAESKAIVAQEGIYDGSEGRFAGIWGTIKQFSGLLGALIAVWGWLWVFNFFWSKSPWSYNAFTTYTLAFLTFWGIQFVILLVTASRAGEPVAFVGGENSITYFAVQPLLAFVDFFKAVPYLLSPASKVVERIENVTTG